MCIVGRYAAFSFDFPLTRTQTIVKGDAFEYPGKQLSVFLFQLKEKSHDLVRSPLLASQTIITDAAPTKVANALSFFADVPSYSDAKLFR